jgi:malonyl-ACP decarboxylase
MRSFERPAITGLGVVSAIGQGKAAFLSSLLRGEHAFGYLQRAGRVSSGDAPSARLLGAELPALQLPAELPEKTVRGASLSAQAALACVDEAYREARLQELDAHRIGLIVGGSNFQQRELHETYRSYAGRRAYLKPSYALSFMDSDVCGYCTAHYGIRGVAYTLGGASASGQLAVLQAAEAVSSGQLDACIAVGALMDLSAWECQAFRSLGAMGSDAFADQPARACRPFDRDRDGFVYGEACAALVIEAVARTGRSVERYATLRGWAVGMDGNRGAEPSLEGERYVIEQALARAELSPDAIDYVNPHGSGSKLGDETELRALAACGLGAAAINTTKSITGHGLSAAGAVELVATALQMRSGTLHPSRNLEHPIERDFAWVVEPKSLSIKNALSLSIGFGGVSTAVCLQQA